MPVHQVLTIRRCVWLRIRRRWQEPRGRLPVSVIHLARLLASRVMDGGYLHRLAVAGRWVYCGRPHPRDVQLASGGPASRIDEGESP